MSDREVVKLKEYAGLEGAKLGEVCLLLCQLSQYTDYLSVMFGQAVDYEIKRQLQYFQDCTEIVTKSKTTTYKELQWNI